VSKSSANCLESCIHFSHPKMVSLQEAKSISSPRNHFKERADLRSDNFDEGGFEMTNCFLDMTSCFFPNKIDKKFSKPTFFEGEMANFDSLRDHLEKTLCNLDNLELVV